MIADLRLAAAVLKHVHSHPSNARHRWRAIAQAVRFQVRGRLGRRTLVRIGERGNMFAELHYTGGSSVAYANPPDYLEMLLWRRVLSAGDLFVDVGSNVGSYALWAGDCGAEVIAVEPNADAARRLRENVALNDFAVEVVECGLANHAGEGLFTQDLDTVNHLLLQGEPGGTAVRTPVTTLDLLLAGRRARGVKIDVEGAERLVLSGAAESLSAHRVDVVQLEWNDMSEVVLGESRVPVAELLQTAGYVLVRPVEGSVEPVQDLGSGPDLFALSPAALSELLEGAR